MGRELLRCLRHQPSRRHSARAQSVVHACRSDRFVSLCDRPPAARRACLDDTVLRPEHSQHAPVRTLRLALDILLRYQCSDYDLKVTRIETTWRLQGILTTLYDESIHTVYFQSQSLMTGDCMHRDASKQSRHPTLIMHHAVDCDSSAALAEVAVTTGAEVLAATEDGIAPV